MGSSMVKKVYPNRDIKKKMTTETHIEREDNPKQRVNTAINCPIRRSLARHGMSL